MKIDHLVINVGREIQEKKEVIQNIHLHSARIPLLQSYEGRSPTISGGGIAVRYGMVR
ncbi:hypothetical protein [Bacillus cereus]|uniref:hypothetical protein n=1 Tax=Bacillus cereus TaxID=1396 RepID=UPI0015970116